MFCPNAIWLDRGRIVKAGPSLEVVKAYQQFTRVLDERRLQAKNQKVRSGDYLADQLESYVDSILLRLGRLEPEHALRLEPERDRALGMLVRKGYGLELAYDALRRYAGVDEPLD